MYRRTTIESHQNTKFDDRVSFSNTQIKNTLDEEQTRTVIDHNTVRVTSADYSRRKTTMVSSNTRSTAINTEEYYRTKNDDEKRGLNMLNTRFASYLDEIKCLADINIDLRRRIDDIHQTYMGHNEEGKSMDKGNVCSSENEVHHLRGQLNNELRQLISTQIRLQRADHDRKYYRSKLKLFSKSEQKQLIQQKLDGDVYELQFLQEQYEKQQKELELNKTQYHEYIVKLNNYADEYHTITYKRMKIENYLYTLREQLLFEREYKQRCQDEFDSLEKIQYDSNHHFNETEFENTLQKIRRDYQQYNESQLSELEVLYQTKLDSIPRDSHSDQKESPSEDLKELTAQNRSLEQKKKQLETDLYQTVEHNRQQYERSDEEYHQLEGQLPELEALILFSRENTVYLSSEISTYRCLLINLYTTFQQKSQASSSLRQTAGFTVHHDHGMIWVRI